MNLKSYYAATVELAMAQASRELGPEALLVLSRETPAENREWGRFEVVFGWTQNGGRGSAGSPFAAEATQRLPAAGKKPVDDSSLSGDTELRSTEPKVYSARIRSREAGARNLEPERGGTAARTAKRPSSSRAGGSGLPSGARLAVPARRKGPDSAGVPREAAADGWEAVADTAARYLENAGFSGKLVPGMAQAVARFGTEDRSSRFWAELESFVPGADRGRQRHPESCIWVGGPAGSGKSLAIARLALGLLAEPGRQVHIVSTDGSRLCGGHWVQRFAELAGVRFSLVKDPDGLDRVLHSRPLVETMLVEMNDSLLAHAGPSGGKVHKPKQVEFLLTVPAPYSREALDALWRRYSVFGPDALIATHLDEAATLAPLCSMADARAVGVAWVSSSPMVATGWARAHARELLGKDLDALAGHLASPPSAHQALAVGGAR